MPLGNPGGEGLHRSPGGRFARGNAGGPGNPFAMAVGRLRAALLKAVTEEDIEQIVAAIVRKAKGGDVVAARELLDRTLGRPVEADLIERIEALEAARQGGPDRRARA